MNKSVDPNALLAAAQKSAKLKPRQAGSDQAKLVKNLKRLETIIQFDARARTCNSLRELYYHAANSTGAKVGARQVMVLEYSKAATIKAISGIASVDGKSSAISWLETQLGKLWREKPVEAVSVCANLQMQQETGKKWALPHLVMTGTDVEDTRIVLAYFSDQPFSQNMLPMAEHFTRSISHCARQFQPSKVSLGKWLNKKMLLGVSVLITAAMFIPVPLTVLTPVEIAARDPVVVAAPLAGVIENVLVDPNTQVSVGQLLVRYDARELENNLAYAERQFQVAKSRLHSASQNAFGKGRGKREMAALSAEAQLAQTRVEFARTELEMSEVYATNNGVALFSSSEEWTGKPVATGERLMKIADPGKSKIIFKLSANDASLLHSAQRARVFLNGAPLSPFEATILTRSYDATISSDGVLSYELTGLPREDPDNSDMHLRIGERGAAQIIGPDVSLGYLLFRRPLSALRRYLYF